MRTKKPVNIGDSDEKADWLKTDKVIKQEISIHDAIEKEINKRNNGIRFEPVTKEDIDTLP